MRNENKETNQGKKAIGESMGSRIVLALIVVAVIVTAAKVIPLVRNRVQTSQYPVIELADLQGMELESLSDGKFSFSYPAEDWEVWEQVTTDYHPLTIFYKGTADDGSTSISVAENDTVVTQLKPELLQVMLDGLKEQAPYMVIKESEMRSMEGTPVFYLEDNMSLTQEGLDMMVDTGAWTEETIEAMGGREALLSNNIASDQIQIYHNKLFFPFFSIICSSFSPFFLSRSYSISRRTYFHNPRRCHFLTGFPTRELCNILYKLWRSL